MDPKNWGTQKQDAQVWNFNIHGFYDFKILSGTQFQEHIAVLNGFLVGKTLCAQLASRQPGRGPQAQGGFFKGCRAADETLHVIAGEGQMFLPWTFARFVDYLPMKNAEISIAKLVYQRVYGNYICQ